MDGWMEKKTDGFMHGWMDGWMDLFECRTGSTPLPSRGNVGTTSIAPEP